MATIHSWISALRPRTLFLAVSTTLCGSGMAYAAGSFSIRTCILTILTATLLQLLSNLANDLGDFQHGTDITGERLGPTRAVQSGEITPQQMKIGILIAILLSIIVGSVLIFEVLRFTSISYLIFFFILGGSSIIAAIKYTTGKNPYGYQGLGDIFCFIFFGLVSVVGTYFLHCHKLNFQPWLPAIGMGFFTTAVLNINNMRDIENDLKSGKITLAIRLGINKAKIYHMYLTIGGIISFMIYGFIYLTAWYQYLYFVLFIPFIIIQNCIFKTLDNKLLDPFLKYTSLSTFFLAFAFIISINL